jgi:hypothetical protein
MNGVAPFPFAPAEEVLVTQTPQITAKEWDRIWAAKRKHSEDNDDSDEYRELYETRD